MSTVNIKARKGLAVWLESHLSCQKKKSMKLLYLENEMEVPWEYSCLKIDKKSTQYIMILCRLLDQESHITISFKCLAGAIKKNLP